MINLVIPGEPVAKGRPRAVRTRTSVRIYTPDKTVMAEERIRLAWLQVGKPKIEGKAPISLHCRFIRSKPKSARKKDVWPVQRPDQDNLLKLVLDALCGLAFEDDSQIVDCHVSKEYGTEPRTEIKVSLLTSEGGQDGGGGRFSEKADSYSGDTKTLLAVHVRERG